MKRYPHCVGLLLLGAAVSCTHPLAAAQVNDTTQDPGSTIRVGAKLVLVDVIVTDKDGKHVRNLTQGDFTVYEGGKRQEIASFSFVDAMQTDVESDPLPELPPDVYTNRPEYHAPTGQLTVILLDELNTPPHLQLEVRKQALSYINDKFDSTHPAAILLLRDKLTVLEEFSADPARLRAALENYQPRISVMMSRMRTDLRLPTSLEQLSPEFRRMALELKRDQLEWIVGVTDARVRDTVQALEFIARNLAGHPGRKNLVWVSSFFPLTITPNPEELPDPDLRVGLSRSYLGALRRAARILADAQVALYTVDARGLRVPDPAEYGAPVAVSGGRRRSSRDFANQSLLPVESEEDSQETLRDFALRTGGRAFLKTNDIAEAIAKGVEDGSRYYMVGFRPSPSNRKKEFRKIRVRVKKKGVRVRHRPGYFPMRAAGRTADEGKPESVVPAGNAIVGVVADPSLNATELTFLSQVIPHESGQEQGFTIKFLVDANRLNFSRTSDGRRALDLDFYAGTYSSDAKLTEQNHRNIKVQLTEEDYRKSMEIGISYSLNLTSDGTIDRLLLVVRDNSTGRVGSLTLPFSENESPPDK